MRLETYPTFNGISANGRRKHLQIARLVSIPAHPSSASPSSSPRALPNCLRARVHRALIHSPFQKRANLGRALASELRIHSLALADTNLCGCLVLWLRRSRGLNMNG